MMAGEFWECPDFSKLKIQEKEDFKTAFQNRKVLPITVYNPVIDFNLKNFHALYSDVANLALHFRLTQEEKSLSELRQRINALCNYPSWGARESKEASLQRALPSILLSLAYIWTKEELPSTELLALQQRLQKALYRYWNEYQTGGGDSWSHKLNHTHYPLHLLAMVALSHATVEVNNNLATEVMHHMKRQFSRYLRIMGDAKDGSLPQGLSVGSLTDMGIMLYLENELRENRLKDFEESDWLKQRCDFYKMHILPGQKEILKTSLGDHKPKARLAPILWRWADWYQDRELQFLAEECDRRLDLKWDMWSFLKLLARSRELKPYWNDELQSQYFLESGVWTARSGRRPQSSQLSFICGNPFGETIYKVVREGYPNFKLSESTPSQGAISWYCEGRHIFEHAGGLGRQGTQHYNTLLIDDRGQLFEGYPNVLPETLIERSVSGTLQNNLRFGDSLLARGEFANCYPDDLGLQQYNRTLIWLGETILVVVDIIQTDKPKNLALIHRSSQLNFIEAEQGFYQKISGLQMKTWSKPEGTWQIGQDSMPETQVPHYFATHHARTNQWLRVSVMAPSPWVQDFRVETSAERHLVEFSEGGYQIHLMPKAASGDSWLKVLVRQKTFFDLKVDL